MNIWTFLVASHGGIQCVAYITYITRLLDWNADTFAITSLYSGLSGYLHILSMPVCWCVLLASVIRPYSTITLGGLTVFFIKISYTTARITTQKRENWSLKECQITPNISDVKLSKKYNKLRPTKSLIIQKCRIEIISTKSEIDDNSFKIQLL